MTAEYRPLERQHVEAHPTGKRLGVLTLTALGVVYGDIGTSPLYAMRECFFGSHAVAPTEANVLGVLSLRETLIVTRRPGLALWRERLFVLLSRNAARAVTFFRLPPERVVELGIQVEL